MTGPEVAMVYVLHTLTVLNECTEVLNPRRVHMITSILESAHIIETVIMRMHCFQNGRLHTMQKVVYLCNRVVSEKTTQFSTFIAC